MRLLNNFSKTSQNAISKDNKSMLNSEIKNTSEILVDKIKQFKDEN